MKLLYQRGNTQQGFIMSSISMIKAIAGYATINPTADYSHTSSINKHTEFSQKLQHAQAPKPVTIDMAVNVANNHENVSEQAKALYQDIKYEVRAQLQKNPDTRTYEQDFYKLSIQEIMEVPIKVVIERDEMREAALFNSLGIDFLAYKELGLRQEMLSLAENDIKESQSLLATDKEDFIDAIKGFTAQLEDQKNALLGGIAPDELGKNLEDRSSPWAKLLSIGQ